MVEELTDGRVEAKPASTLPDQTRPDLTIGYTHRGLCDLHLPLLFPLLLVSQSQGFRRGSWNHLCVFKPNANLINCTPRSTLPRRFSPSFDGDVEAPDQS